ncbi:MAG: CAP domain-containing protein [Polyangiaceae bacterium]|nr:CAP domain-containing protein [Polyangiaceae bacterium]
MLSRDRLGRAAPAVAIAVAIGCGATRGGQSSIAPAADWADPPVAPSASAAPVASGWAPATRAPREAPADPATRALSEVCGAADASLATAAAWVAAELAAGRETPEIAAVTYALRALGAPYVWPRLWTLSGGEVEAADLRARLERWRASFDDGGERRCGVARVASDDGHDIVVAIGVDSLASLEPLPTSAAPGAKLAVTARLPPGYSRPKLVVLGPAGRPRSVETRFERDGTARATFSPDRAGSWLVQMLASGPTGPRPVLEAWLHAGVTPPLGWQESAVPGEDDARSARDATSALTAMINGARAAERLAPLRRDSALDRVAQAHADAMRGARRVGHDVGDGDPARRVAATGLALLATGENVAHARSIVRAHRALWSSPSHRDNLLVPRFEALGVGIAVGDEGTLWVCETFADFE